jgi:hypothetical protein
MLPVDADVREALKKAHPGLTDADIDRYDALTSLRASLDPRTSADQIRRIDAERDAIVRTKMPRLGAIENAIIMRSRAGRGRLEDSVKMEPRPPRERGDG